ncbi:hypothetical protein L3Y25_gp062 [Gordonia phage Syleon]|uniref:Uncharacterized protein n=2 Tax=Octobienvirus TaxID=3044779 RepID=A0A5Q2WBE7_9CAUD|nr:hypothetical protein L3Y23_gp060 [Gordonia Phage Sephiroth]YP_010246721.1 hypothetical protein L3Y25_gp062 [Gordonia phage Syleon]QGH75791.1 hypothetical protein SEA_SYLEON_62 [Gordonia phage Syleon]QNN99402.1 hypothetical protein SEA_SEPHIROTH_60 [Gordonia Phage Sephiroth]
MLPARDWIRHDMPSLPDGYTWRIDYIREKREALIRLTTRIGAGSAIGVSLGEGRVPVGANTPNLVAAACVEVGREILAAVSPLELSLPTLHGYSPGLGMAT